MIKVSTFYLSTKIIFKILIIVTSTLLTKVKLSYTILVVEKGGHGYDTKN